MRSHRNSWWRPVSEKLRILETFVLNRSWFSCALTKVSGFFNTLRTQTNTDLILCPIRAQLHNCKQFIKQCQYATINV